MAVLESLPGPDDIKALRGTLDFYVWRGLPVVRKWPRKPRLPRSSASHQAAVDFGDNAHALSSIPATLITAAADFTQTSDWTWRDLWTATIYGNPDTW